MRLSGFRFPVPAVALLALGTVCCSAARAEEPVGGPEQAIQAASENGTLLYLVFYREADAATIALRDTVKATADRACAQLFRAGCFRAGGSSRG